jgi:hypothetical protein
MSYELINNTPFSAAVFPHTRQDGTQLQVVIAKGTWLLGEGASGRLAPPEKQVSINRFALEQTLTNLAVADCQREALDERQGDKWTVAETDCVPPKPLFDLIVNGWALSAQPQETIDCGLDYQSRRLISLRAYAPRRWKPTITGLSASFCGAVHRVPLLLPFSFGGATEINKNTKKFFESNPDGMGFYGSSAVARDKPLPWVERHDNLIAKWSDAPPPIALGYLPASHASKQKYQGTFDAAWRETRAPNLPADFDSRYYNSAPSELQLTERPKPGHRLTLHNMTSTGKAYFDWPTIALTAQAQTSSGTRLRPLELLWDTLIVDSTEQLASLIWKAELMPPFGQAIGKLVLGAQVREPRHSAMRDANG